MKVIFVTTQLDFIRGGGSNFDRDQRARALLDLGCEVRIITALSFNNHIKDKLPYEIIEENLHPKKLSFLKFHKAVAEILRKYEHQADIFYVDGHVFGFGAGLYKSGGGKKIISHYENYGFPTGLTPVSFRKKVMYFLKKSMDQLVFSRWENKVDLLSFSSPVAAGIYKNRGLDERKFFILPNVLDVEFFTQKVRDFLCNNPTKFHILYSGRLIKEKGVEILIKAATKLKDLDIGIDIVGGGPEKDNLKKMAKKLNVDHTIYWYNRVDRDVLSSLYHHAELFVFPVIWTETFGVAALEAMACGVPTIVASDTGTAWAVGDDALVFKRGSYRDLAEKIRAVYGDEKLRNRLSERGKQKSKEYDYKKVNKVLYEKMLELDNLK
jgi:glycosyltransferase involved in cell wall biosynthesis